MVDARIETFRTLWQTLSETKKELVYVKTKVRSRGGFAEKPDHEHHGMVGISIKYAIQLSILLKEDFDVFEKKLEDGKFYSEVVS